MSSIPSVSFLPGGRPTPVSTSFLLIRADRASLEEDKELGLTKIHRVDLEKITSEGAW